MPVARTFDDENQMKVLGSELGASYTQVFELKLADAERVLFLLVGHASVDVAFDVTIATDSSGTSPTDLATTAIDADDADKVYTIEVDAAQLTGAKQYLSPKVTWTAGTFTLIQILRGLRNKGNLTKDSSYQEAINLLG